MRFSSDPKRGAVVTECVCLRLCLNQVQQRNAPWTEERKNVIKPGRGGNAWGNITLYESSSALF